ncbi:MAG: hypothetical protein JHD00_05725 [Akkermansiaceae bacterium]|nr:hypothetical protein [Akkermansiaceae bacterium]
MLWEFALRNQVMNEHGGLTDLQKTIQRLAPRPPVNALQWAVGLGAKQGHFPARTLTTDLRERCRGASAGKSP